MREGLRRGGLGSIVSVAVCSIGLKNVNFEVDNKLVADKVSYPTVDESEFGVLIHQCSMILVHNPTFKRHINGVDHDFQVNLMMNTWTKKEGYPVIQFMLN